MAANAVSRIIAGAPWLLNIGTRLLMPALPFLALMASLPRAFMLSLVLSQALSWPQITPPYAAKGAWASGVTQPGNERQLAGLVETNTSSDARILDLANAPAAINSRHLVNAWQTAKGDRLVRSLNTAMTSQHGTLVEWRATLTHLPGEAVVLHALGFFFRGQSRAVHWESHGASVVIQEMERQIRADGSLFELATYCHVYSTDMFLFHTVLNPLVIVDRLGGTPRPHGIEQFRHWPAAPTPLGEGANAIGSRAWLALSTPASLAKGIRSRDFAAHEPSAVLCCSRQGQFPMQLAAAIGFDRPITAPRLHWESTHILRLDAAPPWRFGFSSSTDAGVVE